MAEKFIGAQIRAGQFTDKATGKLVDYNNLVLSTVSSTECGEVANEPVKIPNTSEKIVSVFGRPISMKWLRAHLGQYCDIFYDKYKKVDKVIFYDENPNLQPVGYTGTTGEGITDYTPAPVVSSGGLSPDPDDDFPNEFTSPAPVDDKKSKEGKK